MNAIVATEGPSVISAMAERFGMDRRAFEATLMKTVMPAEGATHEQVAAFLLVARKYDLNPFTKEIYAFPAKGGIQPIVSIDGWLKIINDHPQFDGMEFADKVAENGKLEAVTCRIYRKDRAHPVEVTEYMAECKRETAPWKGWPARMLRHKAAIQAARYAFGFSGIMDPDEADRAVESVQASATPTVAMPQPKARIAAAVQTASAPSEAVEAVAEAPDAAQPLSESLRRILAERARKASVTMEDIERQYGDVTTANLQEILADLRAMTKPE